MAQPSTTIRDLLVFLYGEDSGRAAHRELQNLLERYRPHIPFRRPEISLSEKDSVLITYGDMVRAPGEAPLATLASFLQVHVGDTVGAVHLLPFYPWTSDDGFSVVDYKQVDPALGSWQQVTAIGDHFRLMFDAVINHISAGSRWFRAFLRDDPRYRDYFVVVEPGTDLSDVFRPRALPLLTPVQTAAGEKLVWTTFSSDQIDLNYRNPDVLLEIVDVLLFYVAQGAELIRLDAIAFMWKELGTDCIHLPQTHAIIQLLRAVLDVVAPNVVLITETNVPHADNISYFGDGHNEAQMVYNFSLPPLTLHAFHSANAEVLSRWATTLTTPSRTTTFFNFLASHDGIGVTPARGLLSESEITAMAERVKALGGHVSYRNKPDGSQSVYELNINFLDALGEPDSGGGEEVELVARRFLATQAIMLALEGVPGIYFHSLFGSRGWPEGVEETGRARTINREKLQRADLERELGQPGSLRRRIFDGYRQLLQARRSQPAFAPTAPQSVLTLHPAVFALLRRPRQPGPLVLALHNVSPRPVALAIHLEEAGTGPARDLLSGSTFTAANNSLSLALAPYGVLWLELAGFARERTP